MSIPSRLLVLLAVLHPHPLLAASESDPQSSAGVERLRLEQVVANALGHAPALLEARGRARAASAQVDATRRRPDAELKYEQWGVPLTAPWALGMADTLMVGVRQAFPPTGAIEARARASEAAARGVEVDVRLLELEMLARVRTTYAEYQRGERELHIRRQHLDLTERVIELARASYSGGGSSQADVLRLAVEQSRLRGDLIEVEQRLASAAAQVNVLMGRPATTPFAASIEDDDAPARAPDVAGGERPELAAVTSLVTRFDAEAQAARVASERPTYMFGADYMYMPMAASRHTYGLMASMSLPWLNPRRDAEVRAAEESAAAAGLARPSLRATFELQAFDAKARLDAAVAELALVDGELLPRIRESFELTRAGFAAGRETAIDVIDTLRSLLLVQVQRVQILSRIATARAELDRANGVEPAAFLAARSKS